MSHCSRPERGHSQNVCNDLYDVGSLPSDVPSDL